MQAKLWDQVNRGGRGAFRYRLIHGGLKKTGKRKDARPFIPGKWVHLILKSNKARGVLSLSRRANEKIITETLRKHSKRNFVQVKEWVNMGNHLHLRLKFSERSGMQRFLRAVPGIIARRIQGAQKGSPKGRFWDGLAFTRILSSSLETLQLSGYFRANLLEKDFWDEARKTALHEVNSWIRDLRQASRGLPAP
jgi:REP element-mobilizing transposase RayT